MVNISLLKDFMMFEEGYDMKITKYYISSDVIFFYSGDQFMGNIFVDTINAYLIKRRERIIKSLLQ